MAGNKWDLKNWQKKPVTFFEALGLPTAKIQWPKLEPAFSKQYAKAHAPSTGNSPSPSPGPAPSNTSEQANQALGQKMAASFGWTGAQWDALNWIVMQESGWNVSASNQSSGAYGIPQALPGSKMATAGSDWKTNPRTQIAWMLVYIKTRYGTPERAKAFHEANGWY